MNQNEKMQKLTALHKDIIGTTQQLKQAEITLAQMKAEYERLKAEPDKMDYSTKIAYRKASKEWFYLRWTQTSDGNVIGWSLGQESMEGYRMPLVDVTQYTGRFLKIFEIIQGSGVYDVIDGVIIGCSIVYLDRVKKIEQQYPQLIKRIKNDVL